jgi:hypothetical protein
MIRVLFDYRGEENRVHYIEPDIEYEVTPYRRIMFNEKGYVEFIMDGGYLEVIIEDVDQFCDKNKSHAESLLRSLSDSKLTELLE